MIHCCVILVDVVFDGTLVFIISMMLFLKASHMVFISDVTENLEIKSVDID